MKTLAFSFKEGNIIVDKIRQNTNKPKTLNASSKNIV